MENLIPMEFENQRIISTKVLAEQFGTNEQNISRNFTRNSTRFIEGKHYFKLEGEDLKSFKGYVQNDDSLKFVSVLYLWTEKGAARHAKILETEEAWEVYERLEETYFNVKEAKQLSPMDQLKLQLKVLEEQDKKIEGVSSRISKIEDQMTIETGKQKVLSDLVTERVMEVLGGKEAPAYKELSKKAFSQCWRDFKRVLNVASYKDTPIKDYDWAIEVIDSWKPSRELELMIMGSNSQVRM